MKRQSQLPTNLKQVIPKLEKRRLQKLCSFEEGARQKGYQFVAGVDEVGRGCLAGPVVAAACYIPADVWICGVDDSKKLSPEKRQEIYDQLTTHAGILYGVAIIDHLEIDRINIYQASKQAMQKAVEAMPIVPDYLLVDGMPLETPMPAEKIIGGDALSYLIAAASIIAKVTRDNIMREEYHPKWPHYGFDQNKGYGTPHHLEALSKHGPCSIHRFSFEPVRALQKVGAE
jgi:ribonuclease HII